MHGGPELDWMDCDNTSDFNAPTTLRNTLNLNGDGLYIGINENNVSGINQHSWQFDTNGNLFVASYTANSLPKLDGKTLSLLVAVKE
jgi:hypothetical protein